MNWSLRLVVAASCGTLSLVAGCTVPLDQYGEELTRSTCERDTRCCRTSERLWPNETECRKAVLPGIEKLEALLIDSEKAGRLSYDATLAWKCFDALRRQPCTDSISPTSCAGVFVGHVADGSACAHDLECMTVCRPDAAGTLVCAPLGQLGERCAADAHCALGLYCDSATGQCATLLPLGAACDFTAPCDAGLYCDLVANPSVCTTAPPICTGA